MHEHFWTNVYFAVVAFTGALVVLLITSDWFMTELEGEQANDQAAGPAPEMTHADRKSKLLAEALAALEKSFPGGS